MSSDPIHAVTGAYGYSGKYIAQRLLDRRPDRHHAHQFRLPSESLWRPNQGISVRLRSAGAVGRASARRVGALQHVLGAVQSSPVQARRCRAEHPHPLRCRQESGCPADCPCQHHQSLQATALEYFRGKAVLENALIDLRHFPRHPSACGPVREGRYPDQQHRLGTAASPVFGVFGDGRYRLQPIYVDDLAALAVEQGKRPSECDHQRHRPGDLHVPRTRGRISAN